MNSPHDLASSWWDSLTPAQREIWLDAAQSGGRGRTPIEAYGLRRDIQAGAPVLRTYRTENGFFAAQIITDGQTVLGIGGYATVQEIRRIAEQHGFPDIPVLYAQFLTDVPGFDASQEDEPSPTHKLTR